MQIRVPLKIRCGTSQDILHNPKFNNNKTTFTAAAILHFSEHWPSLERLEGKGSRRQFMKK